ncbi:hypothetical protein QO004_004102 [Rhizobium mesoamericanum]|nr:hypothetical protein [Rhizobium mesoamericanum]
MPELAKQSTVSISIKWPAFTFSIAHLTTHR